MNNSHTSEINKGRGDNRSTGRLKKRGKKKLKRHPAKQDALTPCLDKDEKKESERQEEKKTPGRQLAARPSGGPNDRRGKTKRQACTQVNNWGEA